MNIHEWFDECECGSGIQLPEYEETESFLGFMKIKTTGRKHYNNAL